LPLPVFPNWEKDQHGTPSKGQSASKPAAQSMPKTAEQEFKNIQSLKEYRQDELNTRNAVFSMSRSRGMQFLSRNGNPSGI